MNPTPPKEIARYFDGRAIVHQLSGAWQTGGTCHITTDERRGTVGVFKNDHTPAVVIEYAEFAAPNVIRGNHFHEHCRERCYLARGSLCVDLLDLASGTHAIFILQAGQRLDLAQRVAHRFLALKPSCCICSYDSDPTKDRQAYTLVRET